MTKLYDDGINRREFLKEVSYLGFVSGMIFLVGCGGGGGNGDNGGTPGQSDITGSISGNHGHTVVLTVSQLEAGAAVTLNLTIGDGHTHTVRLSADEVQNIASGGSVTNTSSTDSGHSHGVTFQG
jgi:hypothetical protein